MIEQRSDAEEVVHVPDVRTSADDLERQLIGVALIDISLFRRVSVSDFSPESFVNPIRRALWTAIIDVVDDAGEIDTVRLIDDAHARLPEKAKSIPREAIRNEIVSSMEAPGQGDQPMSSVMRSLERASLATQIRAAASRLQDLARDGNLLEPSVDIEKIVGPLVARAARTEREAPRTIAELVRDVAARAESKPLRVKSGAGAIDRVMKGWVRGTVNVLGARPGNGKTTYGTHLALRYSELGDPAGIIELEQGAEELASMIMAGESRTVQDRFLDSTMSEEDWSRYVEAAGRVSTLPIHVREPTRFDWPHIRGVMMELIDRKRCGLVMIDYLQLIEGDVREKRNYQIGRITRDLKKIAKRTNVIVVLLAQLARGLDRERKRAPVMADLRDSGSIEQDADTITFLHNPQMTGERIDSQRYETIEVITEKNRHGTTGRTSVSWDKARRRFEEAPDWKQGEF